MAPRSSGTSAGCATASTRSAPPATRRSCTSTSTGCWASARRRSWWPWRRPPLRCGGGWIIRWTPSRASGRSPRSPPCAGGCARAARAPRSWPTSGPTPCRTSTRSTRRARPTWSRARRRTWAPSITWSTPCSTAATTAWWRTSAARAPRPSARRRSACTSRSAPARISCWPSRGWASTRACRSSATRWSARWRSPRPRSLHLLEDLVDHRVVVGPRLALLPEQPGDHVVGPVVRGQQQEAQHGDAQVALGLRAGAAEAALVEHAHHRLVLVLEPRHGHLLAGHQVLARVAGPEAPGLHEHGELGVAPLVAEPDPRTRGRGQRHALVEDALVLLEGKVAQPQRPVGAQPRGDEPYVRLDRRVAHRPGDGHPVVAVLDEVQLADPVHVDRRQRLAAPAGGGDPLPTAAHVGRGGGGSAGASGRRAAAIRCQRPRTSVVAGRNERSNVPVERSTVPTIESSGMSCTPRSLSLRRPSAATTSSNGSMGDTSSGPERRREASNDRARRRRCLTKSLSAAVSGVLTAAIVRPSRTFRILPRARSGWTGWRKMGRFAAVGPRAPPGAGSSAQRAANERAEHRRIAVDQVVVPAHGDREVLVREVPELGMAPDEVPGMAPHLVPV